MEQTFSSCPGNEYNLDALQTKQGFETNNARIDNVWQRRILNPGRVLFLLPTNEDTSCIAIGLLPFTESGSLIVLRCLSA